MCVTDRHDMTLAVKVALNPDTTNQPIQKLWLPRQQNFKKVFEIYENLLFRNHKAQSYHIWHVALPNGSLIEFFSNYSPEVKFDPTPGVTSFT